MSTANYVDYRLRDDGVAVLTLDNPPLNLNAMPTLRLLRRHVAQIAGDTRVRCVVVTGTGERAFCAGSDIHEFESVMDDVVAKKLRLENEAFNGLAELPVPVIAALNGVTLGGGAEIALACDLRIMAAGARIGFPEVKLGVFPGSGGVFRLPRLVGSARAYELLYTGDLIDAEQALRIGLVNQVVPQAEVLPAALALAVRLAAGPARALMLIRRAVREAWHQSNQQSIAQSLADSDAVFRGPDVVEGVQAFFDKRPAKFTAERDAVRTANRSVEKP
ncbi:MAG TPA: enoyl-CoA hydratase/isomerase family protein [Rhodanobacteraceae bacterium]|nr:enoyl-CoA hydratase/isomerase family protein [Rhodanobacteraceae bacterium]